MLIFYSTYGKSVSDWMSSNYAKSVIQLMLNLSLLGLLCMSADYHMN